MKQGKIPKKYVICIACFFIFAFIIITSLNTFSTYFQATWNTYLATEYSSGTVTINQSGDYIIHNGVTKVIITGSGVNANVVLDNVTINGNTGNSGYAPIQVTDGATANIVLQGENTLTGGYYRSGYFLNYKYYGYAGLQVDKTASVVISGQGSLTAQGGATSTSNEDAKNGGAGIGGGYTGDTNVGFTAGNITIKGGTINATGGFKGAGIGGGYNGAATSGTISIEGGTIVANGGGYAAGIGDGDSYDAGMSSDFYMPASGNTFYKVSITGGNITAKGGCDASGIGSTDNVTNVSGKNSAIQIEILGGTVHAYGGSKIANGGVAIGSGSGTILVDNSITLSSNASIVASSLGSFAIATNISSGTDLPKINVDYSGYNLVVRFPEKTSSQDRTLYLYDENGNIVSGFEDGILVPADYTSFATTLPAPGNYYLEFNGERILIEIPEGGGLITGEIDTNDYQDNQIVTGNKFYPDQVSSPITNIQVFRQGTEDPSLVVSNYVFSSKVKLYTVYVEYGTTTADIKIDWEIPENGSTVLTINGETVDSNLISKTITVNVPQDGKETTVQISKQDSFASMQVHPNVYTINIVMVEKKELVLKGLSKVYDFKVVVPEILNSEVEIPILDRKDIVYTWYNEQNEKIDSAPKDAGTYILQASLQKETYLAEGEMRFTISKRPLSILSVEQYIKMYDGTTALSDSQKISLGNIALDNFIEGDDILISYDPNTTVYEHENPNVDNKIILNGVSVSNPNYEISSTQTVYGEIISGENKAIFTSLNEQTVWRKKFGTKEIDDCNTHSLPIRARSVNNGEEEAVYSVDIEWGDMIFEYASSQWNTEQHEYGEGSWNGMDSVNNKISVINRSNRDIQIQMTSTVDFLYAQSGLGLKFSETNTSNDMVDTISKTLSYKKDENAVYVSNTYVMMTSNGEPPVLSTVTKIGSILVTISG